MKKIFLLIFFALFTYSAGFSQEDNTGDWRFVDTFQVGKRPVEIFSDSRANYIYCAGYDANHNGILDDGDEAPSIWFLANDDPIFGIVTMSNDWGRFYGPVKLIDLDFEDVSLPIRIAFARRGDSSYLYIPGMKGVNEVKIVLKFNFFYFNDLKFEVSQELITTEPAIAVSVDTRYNINHTINISTRNIEENIGQVILYKTATKEFIDTIHTTAGLLMTAQLGRDSLIVLKSRTEFEPEPSFLLYDLSPTSQEEKHKLVSETKLNVFNPYYIFSDNTISKKEFSISSLENSEIRIYNKYLTRMGLYPYGEDTEIRQIYPVEHRMYASSYDGYVYMFNTYNMRYLGKLRAYGRAEGMASSNNSLMIATPYRENSYEAANAITYYGFTPVSVNDDNTNDDIIVFPNPASDFITINEENLINHYEIYSVLGDKIMISESNTIDISKLAKGMYYIKSNYKFYPFVKK